MGFYDVKIGRKLISLWHLKQEIEIEKDEIVVDLKSFYL